MNRLCPACLTRAARLVAADCPICDGAGTIPLGPKAVDAFGAESTSLAVSAALEAVGRAVDEPGVPNSSQRAALADTMRLLEASGLAGPADVQTHLQPAPGSLAAAAIGRPVQPLDVTLPEAPSYRYGANENPGKRGLPVLSADGHPSHIARICDPADPLDNPTHKHAASIRKTEHTARAMAAALDQKAKRHDR